MNYGQARSNNLVFVTGESRPEEAPGHS